MPNDREPSPFTGIAPPEPSAVEQWQERQAQARRSRRQVICGLGCAVVASTLATSIGICVQEGVRPFLAVLVAGLLGALAGLLVGVLIGAACFSLMALSGTRHGPSFESKIARRDPMSVIAVLVVAWGMIGVLVGAAWGGLAGAAWFLDGAPASADLPAAIIGSLAGIVLTGVGWFVLGRRSRRRDSARDDRQGPGA